MKNIILFVLFIIGVVFMQFVQGQTVEEVISKYLDARGGKDKLLAVKSVYMEGARQMMGNEVQVKVTIVQGKLYRNDFDLGSTTGYTIVTPADGWMYIPMRSQTVDPIPADRLKTMQSQMDIFGPLLDYAAKGNTVVLAGKDSINKTECYVVKLTNSLGKESSYYIDTKTNLLVAIKQMAMPMGGKGQEKEVTTIYSDYKAFDGIMFPQTIANTGSGQGNGSTTFDKIEVNQPVDEKLYKPDNK